MGDEQVAKRKKKGILCMPRPRLLCRVAPYAITTDGQLREWILENEIRGI